MRRILFWTREIVIGLLSLPFHLTFLGFIAWQQLQAELRARQHGKVKRILELVEQGSLHPSDTGVITLPANLASASCRGEAYLLRRNNLLSIFVPVWFGKGSNVAGNLICNRPLTAEDTKEDYHTGTCVEVKYPCWRGRPSSDGPGTSFVSLGEQWGPTSYFVYFNLC